MNPDITPEVPVISLASGRVVDIRTRLDDNVKKGQLLIKVQSPDITNAFDTYLKARNDEVLANKTYNRTKDLYDHGAVPLSQLEQAADTEDDAKADLIKAVVQELFRKLAVRKRVQIVRVAIEKGLIKIEGNPIGSPFALRLNLSDQQSIRVGDFVIDAATHQAWVRGVETHLTPSEFQLLWILATHSGKLVKSSALREMFWRNPTARVGSLRVLVGTLRSKIEATKTPQYLITERSLGYRLISSPSLSEVDRPPS